LDGGRANAAGVAGYNHSLNRRLAVCCSCSKSAAKSPALVAVFVGPLKIAKLALPKRMHPLFRLFYQVEIRHHQNPSSKIPDQLAATNAYHNTTRLWQLRGGYVEIAGLRAALESTTRRDPKVTLSRALKELLRSKSASQFPKSKSRSVLPSK
jgi:hypothetical protein